MQYHALSLAKKRFEVELIGYHECPPHPDITKASNIRIIPLLKTPGILNTSNRLLFVIYGPLKAIFQVWALNYVLFGQTKSVGWLLVQNPPSIPTLLIAQCYCFLHQTRLVIDWHNFGYSILALKLGEKHPFVRLSQAYEGLFSKYAYAHFCVSEAMAKQLKLDHGLSTPIVTLYDRPPAIFKVIDDHERMKFLKKLGTMADVEKSVIDAVMTRQTKLVVSSTSWTPDEDFSILLDAFERYSGMGSGPESELHLRPQVLAVITGKGPLKEHFETCIRKLEQDGLLGHVQIRTLFFDALSDYANLLASADLGISLHTSSSGVDLPMKVVDMFGTGLPVAGWDGYQSWPELVKEGSNGVGFRDADGLFHILCDLLGAQSPNLKELKRGALKESRHRWDDEWDAKAGQIFDIQPSR